jgi:copper resistance protein B
MSGAPSSWNNRKMDRETAMNRRIYLLAALMVFYAPFPWARENHAVDHSHHAVKAADKSGKKSAAAASAPATVEMEAMPGMDHGKMNHDAMPQSAQHAGHEGGHGGAASGKEDGMNHGHGSLSMQGGSAPPDARDPHAYSDGYDFGLLPRPRMGDEDKLGSLLVDRLESSTMRGGTAMTYEWQAWYGETYNRALIRAEGDIEGGAFRDARNELLWARAVTAYWDMQLGVRYDSGKGVNRGWLAFGVQGLAPYWLYVEATAYVNEQGRTAFRLETEYDLLLTQKLILQPRVEMNFYSRRDDSRAVNSGLSDFSGGVRFRYEIRREFAPYVGIEWDGRFGSAANAMRISGEVPEGARFIAGAHFWF